MKKIVFFVTHKTLSEDHAQMTFLSMSNQIVSDDKKFDCLYIYKTHQDELPNSFLINLFNEYNLARFFNELKIFDYDPNTNKSLGADVRTITNYFREFYEPNDRILILKSDCILSKTYFDDILNLDEQNPIYFVSPFIAAKSSIDNKELIEYSLRDRYVLSDEITFFVEDQTNSQNNDLNNRQNIRVNDSSIKFVSCFVITDFTCHYITNSLTNLITINYQSWGGAKFYSLVPHFVTTERSFVIHKFHSIISENRSTDREGPVKDWLDG
jgi:hypothetical protein